MKNLSSQHEPEQLREAYKTAKEARKLAKGAYKAQLKALKMQVKPFKQALKRAEKVERKRKEAYKASLKNQEIAEEGIGGQIVEIIEVPVVESGLPRYEEQDVKLQDKPAPKAGRASKKAAEKPAPAAKARKSSKAAATAEGDDLTVIKGIGDKVAEMLHANGITTYAAMAATTEEQFRELLRANDMSKFRNPANWAALAASLAGLPAPQPAETPKSTPAPKARKSSKKAAEKPAPAAKARKSSKAAATAEGDDLTVIKGIGDKVAEMLRANGITTYAAMAATTEEQFKELLRANDMSKFRNPANWAALAASLAGLPAPQPAETPKSTLAPKARKSSKKAAEKPAPAAKARKGSKAAATAEGDDLTVIKGIGDKVAEMLRANGITTYAAMAATTEEQFKELLRANDMSKFRNPANWAALAASLAGLPAPQPAETPKSTPAPKAKNRKSTARKTKDESAAKATAEESNGRRVSSTEVVDDLTKIEGIGPKVLEILRQEGITSYDDVAATSVEYFKEILRKNGMSRFRNPSNWPAEATELIKSR